MSSTTVRTEIKNFLAANLASEPLVDLTGEFSDLQDVLASRGITYGDPWLGVEFIGNGEEPITVQADNGKGVYREMGMVQFHIVSVAKLGVANEILPRAEALRNLLRGRRIGDIIIESVSPPNFGEGATLSFDGGYVAATVFASYEFDNNIG